MSPVNTERLIKEAAHRMGTTVDDMQAYFDRGTMERYPPEAWLFHESTPRQWAGVVIEGEVLITRGQHGSTRQVTALGAGALISESALLDELLYSTSALTRRGATVWQISRKNIDSFRKDNPDVFYRIVARTAQRISDRLRTVSSRLAGVEAPGHLIEGVRVEHDSLSERELPNDVYYGVQTQRAQENFAISGVRLHNFEHMIEALAFVKKAAALASGELGVINQAQTKAICGACDELLAGKLHELFVVDMFQGGDVRQHERQRGHRQPGTGADGS